ncbi:MAG: leucine-rich repeat domain-containing protein, partial [bacterium]
MKKPALIALLTLIVIPLHAADVSDLTFDASGDTITITDCDTGASGTLIIPGTIEGKPVTSIGEDAFFECEFLTSITIPEGVTSIGAWAFDDCYALRTVTIPDSVTSIGRGAFDECYALRTVTIPDSVTSIGDWAFYCCDDLTSIIIPDSVTSIGEGAF